MSPEFAKTWKKSIGNSLYHHNMATLNESQFPTNRNQIYTSISLPVPWLLRERCFLLTSASLKPSQDHSCIAKERLMRRVELSFSGTVHELRKVKNNSRQTNVVRMSGSCNIPNSHKQILWRANWTPPLTVTARLSLRSKRPDKND